MNNKVVKKQNGFIKGLKIGFNILFYAFIAGLIIFSIININVKTNADIPNFLGHGYLSVRSDSMEGLREDSFKKGDLVLVKLLDKKEEKASLQVGDVITFYDMNLQMLNSHRIVDVYGTGDALTYVTQGDKAVDVLGVKYDKDNQAANQAYYERVSYKDVKAVVTGKISNLGGALDYISNPKGGFVYFIVLPTAVFLIVEIGLFIRNLLQYNNEKQALKQAQEKEVLLQELELEKKRMREELLKELQEKESQDK